MCLEDQPHFGGAPLLEDNKFIFREKDFNNFTAVRAKNA